MSAPPIVRQILDQLGPAVLVRNKYWTKKPTSKGWQKMTLKDMSAKFLRTLGHCNIGVLLGEPSEGLCTIDCDSDEAERWFAHHNPVLKATLRSRGVRGCNFWVRIKGNYPGGTVKLVTHQSQAWGEFRSGGGQTIIHGMHPDGRRYTRTGDRPQEIEFSSIVWPKEIANPPKADSSSVQKVLKVQKNPKDTEGTEGTDDTEVVVVGGGLFLPRVKTIADAVRLSLPTDVHTNNRCLFTLARAVKTLELEGGKFTPDRLMEAFQLWYEAAQKFLKPGQTREDYMAEFMNAYDHAKHPLGSSIIPKAMERAKAEALPPESDRFANPNLKLLVGLCRQLQILAGKEPFYLSSRTCQRIFGQENHSTAAKWLTTLVVMQIIERVERGTAVKATRYRYKGQL